MKLFKNKLVVALIFVVLVAVVAFGTEQFLIVEKAHSTFENYYAFRGCAELVQKTDSDATCKTTSGQTVKIVKSHGKWYLDGDLPVCVGGVCW